MRTIGSWDAVAALANEDESGNVIQGDGLLLQSTNTFIHAESRLVTGVGLKNMIVVETRDAVLVANSTHWNSGMFILDAQAYLDALKIFEPSMHEACEEAFQKASNDLDFKRVDSDAFRKSPSLSIDCAVIERIKNLHVIPYLGDWSDVGSWDAVAALANEDESGNVIQGDGLLLQSTNTFIHAESRLVTGIGLENLIVVETRDAVLVANSAQTQNIKDVVDNLKSQNRKEATEHLKIHRPWGSYETLVLGDRFHVKQITVTPGESLSLQKHHHRAEHWVVVHGTAKIRINDAEAILTEDQSIYVPLGAKHRLSNPRKVELILIEVQSGVYLGEDDIRRYDDPYSRNIE